MEDATKETALPQGGKKPAPRAGVASAVGEVRGAVLSAAEAIVLSQTLLSQNNAELMRNKFFDDILRMQGLGRATAISSDDYLNYVQSPDYSKALAAYRTIVEKMKHLGGAPAIPPTPAAAPAGQEYVDPYLFETGHFESREEYEELSRTAKIKPRARS